VNDAGETSQLRRDQVTLGFPRRREHGTAHKVTGVTTAPARTPSGPPLPLEEHAGPSKEQRLEFAARMAFAKQEPPQDRVKRTEVVLRVVLVTLTWLVSVSLLLGWGLTAPGRHGSGASMTLAAVLAVFLPFVAAVIATRNRHFIVGGVYVVITLAMVLPALGMAGAGG
jgi:hypothetical protein